MEFDHLFIRSHRRVKAGPFTVSEKCDEVPVFTGPGGVKMFPCKRCCSPKPLDQFVSIVDGDEDSGVCYGCLS